METHAPKAVFLSYASQDAEAARRIADALRAAGVEVWFDQSELRGGDAWDSKIKKQIRDCSLFVGVISAHTSARREGYFRREWKLAIERTLDRDDDLPFLLPVVIDDTVDKAAHVPDKFNEVQWTRLPTAADMGRFSERVVQLLAGGTASPIPAKAPRAEGPAPARRAKNPAWLKALVATLAIGTFAIVCWRELKRSNNAPAETRATASAPAAGPRDPELKRSIDLGSGAQLTARAIQLYSELGYTRDDLATAEDLARKATELEPGSAAAWGARAGVHATYIFRNWDLSEKRRQDTQACANRALGLNPDEPEALLALGILLIIQGANTDAEMNIRRAMVLMPADNRPVHALARTLGAQSRDDERIALLLAALKGDPRDVILRYDLAQTFADYSSGGADPANLTSALEHVDAGLAVQPLGSLLMLKVVLLAGWRGDLTGMRASLDLLEKLPLSERAEDRAVFIAMWGGLLERDADRVLAAAKLTAKDYSEDTVLPLRPKDWTLALAHRLAGKDNLARLDWQRAEPMLRARLRDDLGNQRTVMEIAITLAWLGRADDAAREAGPIEAAWREELTATRARILALYYAALGDAAKAAPYLRRGLNTSVFFTSKTLPLDPWWDKLRGQPEFDALLADPKNLAPP